MVWQHSQPFGENANLPIFQSHSDRLHSTRSQGPWLRNKVPRHLVQRLDLCWSGTKKGQCVLIKKTDPQGDSFILLPLMFVPPENSASYKVFFMLGKSPSLKEEHDSICGSLVDQFVQMSRKQQWSFWIGADNFFHASFLSVAGITSFHSHSSIYTKEQLRSTP